MKRLFQKSAADDSSVNIVKEFIEKNLVFDVCVRKHEIVHVFLAQRPRICSRVLSVTLPVTFTKLEGRDADIVFTQEVGE